MPTTFVNTIDGNEIYAKRAEQDKDGNQIDTTYAKSAGLAAVATSGSYNDLSDKPSIPSPVTVDQTYDASSTNAQSGTAVAGAIANVEQVPAVTSSDDGKVLKASYSGGQGSYSWQNESGGGGTQVQADWNESDSSAPSYIQNKPTIPEQWSTTTTAISVSGSGESRRFNITGTEVKRYTCSSFNQGGTQSCYIKEDADAMKHDWELLVSVKAETNNFSVKIYNSNNILNKDYFMFTIQDTQPNMPSPNSIYISSMTGEIALAAYMPTSGRKVMIKKVGRTIMCLWA